jgi:hypothetical protein
MITATKSRETFRNAVLAILDTDSNDWKNPVIYAQNVDGDKYLFDSCNAIAMPSDAIPWLYVEADSFGDLTGDHETDAAGIELNMFEQAINDVNDACFAGR